MAASLLLQANWSVRLQLLLLLPPLPLHEVSQQKGLQLLLVKLLLLLLLQAEATQHVMVPLLLLAVAKACCASCQLLPPPLTADMPYACRQTMERWWRRQHQHQGPQQQAVHHAG